MNSRNVRSMLMALAVAGAAGSAWAADLPPVQNQGSVTYLTGGIGQDEAQAFEATASKWPVMLEFAVKDSDAKKDAFLADVSVRILDAKKGVVLDTTSDGPFVLARLEPGRYEVAASFDGKTMKRTLNVTGKGTAREVFVWPNSVEKAGG